MADVFKKDLVAFARELNPLV
jgi:hypothetical protein